ncbi:hypothetical protein Q2K19_21605 [Micromonospora soli]|uniref:hypothetical protein n=1 Tax=Micromonospora sp. NBRC 110009 TaxID=3061627 RepID=UPI002672860A|nr:hypothetical protein [Micromonospora sp. NBRC 110009]WKT96787.1 hypothetical protein Q2K19_21605 [Micromonospora sp. NBRC 110009]
MRLTEQQVRALYGQDVQDRSGATIGSVAQVWADAAGEPTWVGVQTGVAARDESMAPLHGARLQAGRVRLPYDGSTVRGAPAVARGTDQPLGVDQLTLLYRHYQLPGQGAVRVPEQPPPRANGPPEVVRAEERVPVERVRLARDEVVEERPAHAQVRREVVDADVPEGARRDR